MWVPYPQGVQKAEVVGTVKGGRQKWVRFGKGETWYKVAAPLCLAIEATATAQWRKATGGGGGSNAAAPPPPRRQTRRPARP